MVIRELAARIGVYNGGVSKLHKFILGTQIRSVPNLPQIYAVLFLTLHRINFEKQNGAI